MDSTTPTQTPGGAAAMMGPITTVHLLLIAVLAVLTIVMVLWGMRLKARRKAAERAEADHFKAIEAVEAAHVDEPALVAVAPVVVAPTVIVPEAATADPAGVSAPESDLTRLKGLGPKLAAQLAERGLTRIEQIAALSSDEAATLDTQLGSFNGRLSRDRWVEQATLLAAGDTAGYEAQFGKL